MADETAPIRKIMLEAINMQTTPNEDADRARLEADFGKDNVWRYDEVGEVFEIIGFLAPFVSARRKSDGVRGTLMFQHSPRFYFGFQPTA